MAVADFSATPTSGYATLPVTFTDLSTGAVSWDWDFGDGSAIDHTQNPTHNYAIANVYTVILSINGGVSTETKIDYINVNMAADFSALPSPQTFPYSFISFLDSTAGQPTAWAWDFGDSTTSTQQNPTKVYTRSGYYTVTLISSNVYKSDTEVKYNYIHVNLIGIAQKISYVQVIGLLSTWDIAPPREALNMSIMTARGSGRFSTSRTGVRVNLPVTDVIDNSGFRRVNGPTLIFD